MQTDKTDPRASLRPPERSRLRKMARSVARAAYADLIATLGLDEESAWRAETGRDERGWTAEERERFALLKTAGSAEEATAVLQRARRRHFVAYLRARGLIGEGV